MREFLSRPGTCEIGFLDFFYTFQSRSTKQGAYDRSFLGGTGKREGEGKNNVGNDVKNCIGMRSLATVLLTSRKERCRESRYETLIKHDR